MLSAVSILLRGVAVSFNAYVNRKIGAESMGLFTLVMSVYGFAVTVALSCVNLASVRLTSERCAKLDGADAASWRFAMRRVMRAVCLYSLLFGTASGAAVELSAGFIARRLLGDVRTLSSVRALGFSLPAISLSSALSGYFTGIRKVSKNAAASVAEQFVKIAVTSAALCMILPGNVESACFAVVGGSAISEAWTLLLHFAIWIFDTKRPAGTKPGKRSVRLDTGFRDAANIALPSALGTYARQGLTTLEHLAIPRGLVKSGLTREGALSVYGLLQGIAFPLVMFPYAVIGSFTSMLIPETAELRERGDKEGIRRTVGAVTRVSALFSLAAFGIYVNYSDALGLLVYRSEQAAVYTLLLGALVPFMYLDTAVDALLKGLGEQVWCMKVNMADAGAGLILVMLLTPRMGIGGYILTIWLCEVGNLAASYLRLSRVAGAGLTETLRDYIRPISAAGAMTLARIFLMRGWAPVPSMLVFASGYAVLALYPIKKGKPIVRKVSRESGG